LLLRGSNLKINIINNYTSWVFLPEYFCCILASLWCGLFYVFWPPGRCVEVSFKQNGTEVGSVK